MNEKRSSQAGRIFLTVLLAILLLFSAIATVFAADLRCMISEDTVKSVITEVVTGANELTKGLMEDLSQYAAEAINSRLNLQVAPQEIRELLTQSSLPEFVAEKVSESLSGTPATVTQQEVQNLLEDNRELIENALGQPISEEMEQKILDWVEENAGGVLDSVQDGLNQGRSVSPRTAMAPAASTAPAEPTGPVAAPTPAEPITSVFSMISIASAASEKALMMCAAACLVLTLLLILVNWRFPGTGLCVSGSMYLIAGALGALPQLLPSALPEDQPVSGLIKLLIPNMLQPALVMLGLAVVLLICGMVAGALKKKKQNDVAKAALEGRIRAGR